MVDQFHQADIEVYLDVVYNHTGEGGFWRERLEFDFNPDPSITPQLTNFDPKEVVGLYNARMSLNLTIGQRADLVHYLKSL